jgi:hypothetical protein
MIAEPYEKARSREVAPIVVSAFPARSLKPQLVDGCRSRKDHRVDDPKSVVSGTLLRRSGPCGGELLLTSGV